MKGCIDWSQGLRGLIWANINMVMINFNKSRGGPDSLCSLSWPGIHIFKCRACCHFPFAWSTALTSPVVILLSSMDGNMSERTTKVLRGLFRCRVTKNVPTGCQSESHLGTCSATECYSSSGLSFSPPQCIHCSPHRFLKATLTEIRFEEHEGFVMLSEEQNWQSSIVI